MRQVHHNLLDILYHEIATKGNNRGMFERCLADNVKHLLKDVPEARVSRVRGRVRVELADKAPFSADQLEIITTRGNS